MNRQYARSPEELKAPTRGPEVAQLHASKQKRGGHWEAVAKASATGNYASMACGPQRLQATWVTRHHLE